MSNECEFCIACMSTKLAVKHFRCTFVNVNVATRKCASVRQERFYVTFTSDINVTVTESMRNWL